MIDDVRRALGESFYASALDESQQARLERALKLEGFNDEIAFLRVQLHERADREQLTAIAKAVNSIVRAVSARHAMTPQDAEAVKQALLEEVERVSREIDRV